jgi:hypothetical protein
VTEDIGGVPEVEEDWMAAMTYCTLSLEHLRQIYPGRMMLLPETAHEAIHRAMDSVQSSIGQLHRAGKFVLGAERYEQYVREQINEVRREERHG